MISKFIDPSNWYMDPSSVVIAFLVLLGGIPGLVFILTFTLEDPMNILIRISLLLVGALSFSSGFFFTIAAFKFWILFSSTQRMECNRIRQGKYS